MYVRFGGERLETYRSNAARRWALTLLYTAIAPVPLASFAGEATSFMGKSFLKSYVGVCMEGAVIVLACIIFSAYASSSAPTLDTDITTVTMIWKYIGEVIFNMLVLVGLIKGADRIVKELFGT